MSSTSTYQVVSAESTASPAERIQRLGHTMGLWAHDFDLASFCRQVFGHFDFRNKTILELGCRRGILCLWAGLHGAQEVIGLEPLPGAEHDGEGQKTFQAMADHLALPQVKIEHSTIQEYSRAESTLDMVLSVGSISALDEKSCIRLRESPLAYMAYERIFRRVARMTRPGGKLIVVDASRRNFFGDLGLRNPVSPCVEWFKHQQPDYWADLLENCGFGRSKTRWTSGKFLRDLHIDYVPQSLAYFGQSTFRLEMARVR